MACLPLLVPFGANRNIDMQGYILIIAGGCAWASLLVGKKSLPVELLPRILLAIIGVGCILSLVANSHKYYDIVGSPYIRLGSAGLLACMGCGLLVRSVKPQVLIKYLYVGISALAVICLPYSWLKFDSLSRFGGVFAQADIMAVFLGCGLLLGLWLLQQKPAQRRYILVSQLLMSVLLLLSETRVVILLVAVLTIVWIAQNTSVGVLKVYGLGAVGLILLFAAMHILLADRLTSTSYASESIQYRINLQAGGLKATADKPITGYGLGNLADALDCHKLQAADLQKTCRDHYFFNSSHNIFIDRVLGLGWIGGLAYLVFVVLAIWQGLRASLEVRILAYCALLIAIYYLTNVTSIVLELLFWMLLFQCSSSPSASNEASRAAKL